MLAQAGYLIGCEETRQAIVIDPNRDTDQYVAIAERQRLTITHVTETHIHADFISGARELARQTGAQLILSGAGGPDWSYAFARPAGARLGRNGVTIEVGTIGIGVRETPGHTPEHICFLVTDRTMSDRVVGMATGDFIFVGDVGRPDLLERAANVKGSMDTLARALFQSLRATRELPDYLQLWPGHGAGSSCGKSLGAMPFTTLGFERVANWAFQVDGEDAFVAQVLSGQPEPPGYFARMKSLNRDDPPPARARTPLPNVDVARLEAAMKSGGIALDVRSTASFAAGHIPSTINMPAGTSLARWAGTLLSYDQDIILLDDDQSRIDMARHTLMLIGLDRVVGQGGAELRREWSTSRTSLQTTERLDITKLSSHGRRVVVDVRGEAEWSDGHLPGAEHHYLGDLLQSVGEVPHDTPIALYCQGGTRAAIGASLLQAAGFTDVSTAPGGVDAWLAAGLAVTRDAEK